MLRIFLLTILFIGFQLSYASEKVARPNIIVLMAESMGREWVSCYGSKNSTPHIDQLAKEGLQFKIAWATPKPEHSLATFLSGSYRHHTAKTEPGEESFVGKLKEAGYATRFSKAEDLLKELKDLSEQSSPFFLFKVLETQSQSPSEYTEKIRGIDEQVKKVLQFTKEKGLEENTVIVFTSNSGSSYIGEMTHRVTKHPQGLPEDHLKASVSAGQFNDMRVHVPLIVKAPMYIPEVNLYTRDLVDFTDFYPTLLDLAQVEHGETEGKSFMPSIQGSMDPFIKRNWIFCFFEGQSMIRDWHYLYYQDDRLYGLSYDPLQTTNMLKARHNDKIAPHAHERLKMLMDRQLNSEQL